ncbi:hypothetical protein [Bacteroides helcogenes]|uniref:Uncharacterized protein n=1 Tax=Bacteroides helcogenes (strain ATCC 35417 / DSM 20613 / JCM 6297 / CCUG 15421 / P 36-108) TaxID=693979 RepID=E6SNT3_BACT6|nr:hypothetical protein [Bacteroides helcogenes]ADV44816.1 hypothetical protein Bache_2881 [Bacteroides helcogenes P 36-108]MDY5239675.1 hypothetical protein [Bacteroides helcogenes]
MKIDELLNKYFEGETSCDEERKLRNFFSQEEVPVYLEMYRPLFTYLNQEIKIAEGTSSKIILQRNIIRRHHILCTLSGIAAGILLLVGIAKALFPLPDNYVIIDGKRYTDEKLVEAKALEALQNAGFTDEDLSNLLFQH